jgi:hypothetical protein
MALVLLVGVVAVGAVAGTPTQQVAQERQDKGIVAGMAVKMRANSTVVAVGALGRLELLELVLVGLLLVEMGYQILLLVRQYTMAVVVEEEPILVVRRLVG